jgi:hypothetical protein
MPFFGQKTGIILDSAESSNPCIYLRFLKKKENGTWEKSSAKEGKNLKFNLLELFSIRDIFYSPNSKWTTVHKYSNEATPITVENQEGNVVIITSGYNKQFKYPETILIQKLLDHIIEEKITNATGVVDGKNLRNSMETEKNLSEVECLPEKDLYPPKNYPSTKTSETINNEIPENPFDEQSEVKSSNISRHPIDESKENQKQEYNQEGEYYHLPGTVISRSKKAISFRINDDTQLWIPLSVIKDSDKISISSKEGLWIKEWFVKKMQTQSTQTSLTQVIV